MTRKEYFKKAIDLWGIRFVLDMLQEECGELTAAVNRYKRRRDNSFSNLIEELVDVEILLEQAKVALIYGTDKNVYLGLKRKKLKRFKKRVDAENWEGIR